MNNIRVKKLVTIDDTQSCDFLIVGSQLEVGPIISLLETFADHEGHHVIGYYVMESGGIEKIENLGIPYCILGMHSQDVLSSLSDHSGTVSLSNKILTQDINECSVVGFQRHLCDISAIRKLELNAPFSFSLGLTTDYLPVLEVELRSMSYGMVNLNVCKKHIVPNIGDALPTGMTGESMIQIIRYLTNSPNFAGLYFVRDDAQSYGPEEATLIATCLWYIFEGITAGPSVVTESSEIIYSSVFDLDDSIIFAKEENKYWAKVMNHEMPYFACTEEEYDLGVKGILTDRLNRKLFDKI